MKESSCEELKPVSCDNSVYVCPLKGANASNVEKFQLSFL